MNSVIDSPKPYFDFDTNELKNFFESGQKYKNLVFEFLKNYNKETFARNSPFAQGIPPNRKKTKNGNEISKTMAKSWIKSPNGC